MQSIEKIRRYALDVTTFGAAILVVTASFVVTAPEERAEAESPPSAEVVSNGSDTTSDEMF